MPITTHDLKNVPPGHYEILIKEPISEKWPARFDEFTITRTESGDDILTETSTDQSALHNFAWFIYQECSLLTPTDQRGILEFLAFCCSKQFERH